MSTYAALQTTHEPLGLAAFKPTALKGIAFKELSKPVVGEVGFEPTQPAASDLQSDTSLQLCRSPKLETGLIYL